MTDEELTPAEQKRGTQLAGEVSVEVQQLLLDSMNGSSFTGSNNAVLNGALWGLCSAAKAARDASPADPRNQPLELVIAEQARLFLAAMAADDAMGIEQGNA